MAAIMLQQMTERYPNLSAMVQGMNLHEGDVETVGTGCDDQIEFEFGLDLLLDGLEQKRAAQSS